MISKDMSMFECGICGYVYDPSVGDIGSGIAAGTCFADLPETWVCPLCGAGKDVFAIVKGAQAETTVTAEEITKEYRSEDIIIHWYPGQCSHSGICWRDLPQVFDTEKRPWVNVSGASALEIIRLIDRCPSGALKYSLPEGSSVDKSQAMGVGSANYQIKNADPVSIRVIKNGPLVVTGDVRMTDAQGKVIKEMGRSVLCRCGMSPNPPFCDGSHARKGWREQ